MTHLSLALPPRKVWLRLARGEKAAVLMHRLLRKPYNSGAGVVVADAKDFNRWDDQKWVLYSYTKCFHGQLATETDRDGDPLYAYAKLSNGPRSKGKLSLVT